MLVLQEWRRIRDGILSDDTMDDTQRQDRLLALDEKLCMLENAAEEQVTHKNLDVYSQELVQTCLAKMCIDEQVPELPDHCLVYRVKCCGCLLQH